MRKLVVIVAALGLVLALGTPAEAARAFRVKVSLSSSSVMVGQTVTISGTATPTASGRKVTLYQRFAGAKWKREASSRVRSNGTFRFTDRPTKRKARQYRVVVSKGGKYRAGKSKAVRLKVTKARKTRPKVSVSTVSTRTIEAGQPVTVTGRVTRTMAGRYVQLQVGPGGAWGRVGAARINADGTYSVTAVITQAGAAVPLRVVIPASRYNHAVAADAGGIKVYGWHYVSEYFDWEEGDGGWRWDRQAFQMNGTSYEKSVGAMTYYGGTRTNQINLSRACLRFESVLGASDSTESTVRATATMAKDSVEILRRDGIGLGTAGTISLDVTGALRLKFESTRTSGSGDGHVVWGNARVLCAF